MHSQSIMLHLAPPDSGLYFMVENRVYIPGNSVNISDIGAQPTDSSDSGSTLVCVTTNVNMACCRSSDNNNNGSIGDWYYPNGDMVNYPDAASDGENFTKFDRQQQLRLSSRGAPEGPLGEYRCEITDGSGGNANAKINIINILSGKFVSALGGFHLLLAPVYI